MPNRSRTVLGYIVLYLFSLFHRMALGPIAGLLMASYAATASEVGVVVSAYFISYGVTQLLAGFMVDKYGPKRTVLASFPLLIIGTFSFALASHLTLTVASRVMIGLGSATIYVAGLSALARQFPIRQYGSVVGIFTGGGVAGATIGMLVPSMLSDVGISWRTTFLSVGLLSVVSFIIFYWTVKEDRIPVKAGLTRSEFSASLLNRQTVMIATSVLLIYSSFMAMMTWSPKYFSDVYGWSKGYSGIVVTIPVAIQIFVIPALCYLRDKLGKTGPIYSAGFILSSVLMGLLSYSALVMHAQLGVTFLILAASSHNTLILWSVLVRERYKGQNIGIAFSIVNTFVFVGGFIGPLIFGVLLDSIGPYDTIPERVYGSLTYMWGFIFCLLSALIGALLSILAWRR